ncbi:LOW QUALITY PROTEIN: bloodthirsty-related gene family, member 2 [Syngnathus typhle]
MCGMDLLVHMLCTFQTAAALHSLFLGGEELNLNHGSSQHNGASVVRAQPRNYHSHVGLLHEKSLLCSLCEEVFSGPVTTPCGHSLCLACLCHYWTQHRSTYCLRCRRLFANRTDLSVNRVLAQISDSYKSRPQEPLQEKNFYRREVRESRVFSALVCAMQKSHKVVATAIEERQKNEQKKVESLVKELEIGQLTKETAEPDSLTPEKKSDPCLGVTRIALSEIMAKIKAKVNRLSKSELKQIERYFVDVNLSAQTAHPTLWLSNDRKEVRQSDKRREVADYPKRFERVANVLGEERFSGGRWLGGGEKTEWSLGAVRSSINRKGRFGVCPTNGFWTLSLKADGRYVVNDSPDVVLALEQRPRKVGIFVDYAEGHVSFYCADTGVHIYTFIETFTDRLHPFFCPGRLHAGKNAQPLVISSAFCSI